jgi:hypothetical protein
VFLKIERDDLDGVFVVEGTVATITSAEGTIVAYY